MNCQSPKEVLFFLHVGGRYGKFLLSERYRFEHELPY